MQVIEIKKRLRCLHFIFLEVSNMKKHLLFLLVFMTFLANSKTPITDLVDLHVGKTHILETEQNIRMTKSIYSRSTGEYVDIIDVINVNHQGSQFQTTIISKEGQLVITNGEIKAYKRGGFAINDKDFSDSMSMNSLIDQYIEYVFSKHAIFNGQYTHQEIVDFFKGDSISLKDYSESECNDLAGAIDAAQVYYMYLRRVVRDDAAASSFMSSVMLPMIMEYNSNC